MTLEAGAEGLSVLLAGRGEKGSSVGTARTESVLFLF